MRFRRESTWTAPIAPADFHYEYRLVWGNDRRAQGPLELRKEKGTGVVEWCYNGSEWASTDMPGEIANLFEERHPL